ncbi:MAG TPA: DUF4142 domain-containing protein [Planctomycetota bacterium]|nr:DUF4142 domain-containing protein [Planctomycetota bacterium]
MSRVLTGLLACALAATAAPVAAQQDDPRGGLRGERAGATVDADLLRRLREARAECEKMARERPVAAGMEGREHPAVVAARDFSELSDVALRLAARNSPLADVAVHAAVEAANRCAAECVVKSPQPGDERLVSFGETFRKVGDGYELRGARRDLGRDDVGRGRFPRGEFGAAAVERLAANWPAQPKLAVRKLAAKYGEPDVVSDDLIAWKNAGPWKCIEVSTEETPHDFPKPHVDFLKSTVSMRVPVDRVAEISKFDGSITVDRTSGCVSARCDKEEANILALNFAHRIASGGIDAERARAEFSRIIVEAKTQGKKSPLLESLQFQPEADPKAAGDLDRPTIEGAPVRDGSITGRRMDDREPGAQFSAEGEALGLLIALNEGEIGAANLTLKKNTGQAAMDFARQMVRDHGLNLDQTMKLGLSAKVAPLETKAVEELRKKGAEALAAYAALDGDAFQRAYLDHMVKDHQEGLELIDSKLIPAATSEELKRHFTETRSHVAHHLELAKRLAATAGDPNRDVNRDPNRDANRDLDRDVRRDPNPDVKRDPAHDHGGNRSR